MIWYYDIDSDVIDFLRSNLPVDSFRASHNPATLSSKAKAGDLVIFFNYKHSKLYDSLERKGIRLFPSPKITHTLRNRAKQLRELDTITIFPLKRQYIDEYTGIPIPNANLPIMKTGDNHQGIGKYKFPAAPRKMLRKESVVYEQFVENHRAIRILIIANDIFVIEHINDDTWIKNDNPDAEITYHWNTQKDEIIQRLPSAKELIFDALTLKTHLRCPLLGIDYAVGDTMIGLLEANDMVGIPENDIAETAYKNLVLHESQKHLRRY